MITPGNGRVMITGNPSVENVQESIQGGAASFIVKPFNTAKVLDTLSKVWPAALPHGMARRRPCPAGKPAAD